MTSNILSKFGILVIEDFIDARLRADLRAATTTEELVQATVIKHGVQKVDENVRRTQRAKLTEPAASDLKARLLDLKPSLEGHFNLTLKGCYEPHLLVYREGDFFHPHKDNYRDKKDSTEVTSRKVSVVIFLNSESKEIAPDCYGGGSLVFYGLIADQIGRASCRERV